MKRGDITDEQVVRACRDGHPASLERLMADTGAPYKVAEAAMMRADRRGLIDYGVSLRTAWAEPKGLALLAAASVPFELTTWQKRFLTHMYGLKPETAKRLGEHL